MKAQRFWCYDDNNQMVDYVTIEEAERLEAEIKRLQADVKRLETENEEDDNEWKRIVYYLVDAVHAQRGKSIPEDVEHAKDKIESLQAIVVPARHLRSQSRKHTLGCNWSCQNMQKLFRALEDAPPDASHEAAEAAAEAAESRGKE